MYIKKMMDLNDLKISEYACCSSEQYIYIFGGYDANLVHYNDTYRINIKNNEIIKLSTINTPEKRRGMQSIIYNNKMYIFGGQFYDGNATISKKYNDVWYLDLSSLVWTKINITLPAYNQHNYSLVYDGNTTVYIINLGWYSGESYKYNITNNILTSIPTLPEKLLYSGAVYHKNKIYVLCGYHYTGTNDQYDIDKMLIYDTFKLTWSVRDIPYNFKPRSYHGNGGFIYEDKLYFGFGSGRGITITELEYGKLWCYDISNDSFDKIELIKTNLFEYKPLIENFIMLNNDIYCIKLSSDYSGSILKIYFPLVLLNNKQQNYSIKNEFYNEIDKKYNSVFIDIKLKENDKYMENGISNYFIEKTINNETFNPINKFDRFNLLIKR